MTTVQTLPTELRQTLQENGQLGTAHFADEQPANLEQALPRTTEVVLSSLAELAGRPAGREELWQAARHHADAPTTADPQASLDLVKEVLADRYYGTTHAIAGAAGVRPASVATLLGLVAAAALKRLGQLAQAHDWSAEQLSQWLRPHQAEPVGVAARPPVPAAAPAPRPKPWLARPANALLVLVSFIAVGEAGYILGQHSVAAEAPATVASPAGATADASSALPAKGRAYTAIPVANLSSASRPTTVPVPVVLKLNNGVRQVIGANSTESKLYQFLIDPSKEVDETGNDPTRDWIGFDRIYFDPSKATLTNESLWQLSNVASILKRFPDAKIKLGGYTDNTGKPFTNLQLSKARATAAMDALVSLGVPADRLTAVGYGQLDNIASNATEEGRAVNRRVSMQVTQK